MTNAFGCPGSAAALYYVGPCEEEAQMSEWQTKLKDAEKDFNEYLDEGDGDGGCLDEDDFLELVGVKKPKDYQEKYSIALRTLNPRRYLIGLLKYIRSWTGPHSYSDYLMLCKKCNEIYIAFWIDETDDLTFTCENCKGE